MATTLSYPPPYATPWPSASTWNRLCSGRSTVPSSGAWRRGSCMRSAPASRQGGSQRTIRRDGAPRVTRHHLVPSPGDARFLVPAAVTVCRHLPKSVVTIWRCGSYSRPPHSPSPSSQSVMLWPPWRKGAVPGQRWHEKCPMSVQHQRSTGGPCLCPVPCMGEADCMKGGSPHVPDEE